MRRILLAICILIFVSIPISAGSSASGPNGVVSGTYTYDGNLKRVKAVVDGKTIYNIYDAGGTLIHVDAVTDDKKTDYIGKVARVTTSAGLDTITYLHADQLGSANTGTDTLGNVLWREQFTPFGRTLTSPLVNNDQAGFTGHIKDSATGLNYMQARYMDPLIIRFLSTDPIGFNPQRPEMFGRYTYVNNDPVNLTDSTGMACDGCINSDSLRRDGFTEQGMKDFQAELVAGQKGEVYDFFIADGVNAYNSAKQGDFKAAGVAAVLAAVKPAKILSKAKKIFKKAPCCFVAGTLVETKDGLRPIEELEVGDFVLSKNTDTGRTTYKTITDLIPAHERVIWEVSLNGLNGERELFETTNDHPWWIAGQGWKTTNELVAGMRVTTADGRGMMIKSVVETTRSDTTYNLTVADFETYFVGQNKVLVHNCDKKNLKKISEKRGNKAAQENGYKDAHDAKDGRGNSKVNIYKDKKTKKHYLWDGKKTSEVDPL